MIPFFLSFSGDLGHDKQPVEWRSAEENRWCELQKTVADKTGLHTFVVDYGGGGAAELPQFIPVVRDLLMMAASSGITALAYHLLKAWTDSRNGRRIRFHAADIELETTQLSEQEFLKLLAVLRETTNHEELRKRLTDANFPLQGKSQ
jgi:hypothetical protein